MVGIDVDEDALATCASNLSELEVVNFDLVQADVSRLAAAPGSRMHSAVDTVVMNPPFGTKHNTGQTACITSLFC